MCGINGILAYRGGTADRGELRRARDFMRARGPDGFGEWTAPDQTVALGHRRLSIIDLSNGGAQPMRAVDDAIVVTFNGEIYNFETLRRDLEGCGCVFRTRSDTEVLIHLYQRHGPAMVERLRGMFAFALWDARRATLLLARDPYGIKPLYYADDGRYLRFASSVKALIAGGGVSSEADPAGVVGFYLLGSVPEPWTRYKAIKALPAGSWLTVQGDGARKGQSYFSLARIYHDAEGRQDAVRDEAAWFRESVRDSVSHHLVADVPVGAFLSAGVDSGALLGLMRDAGQTATQTVTLGFEAFQGTKDDESPLAEQVARQYGASHLTRRVGADEFHDDLPKILAAMDQPSVDGINTWFVSKAMRELGLKVAISGVGGDELLGGYSTFTRLPKMVRALRFLPNPPGSDRVAGLALTLARALGFHAHPKTAGLLALGGSFPGAYLLQRGLFLPSELRAAVGDTDFVAAGLRGLQPLAMLRAVLEPEPRHDFGKVAVLESGLYLRNQLLRDADWAGMAHALEIRTPLVDSVLLRRVAPLFSRRHPPDGKRLLASAPRVPLPAAIVDRAKTGFGVPLRQWARMSGDTAGNGRIRSGDPRLWSRDWLQYVARYGEA